MKNAIGLTCFALIVLLSSCVEPTTCDNIAANFRDNYDCNLMVQRIEDDALYTTFYGIDLKTHKSTVFEDGSKHFRENLEKFAIGDSVIKVKGQYTITIKRKGKTIVIPYECDGKVYKDK